MAAMAQPLHLRSSFSSQFPHSSSHPRYLSQCRSARVTLRVFGGIQQRGSAADLASVVGGFVVKNLRRLCASQHVGGGSVERNDAAATGPSVTPEAKLTAEEAVEAQMNALAHSDNPRLDHGLEVMYHFANSEGLNGGSLTEYFGFASDLYHFGHFALKFKTRYSELICHNGYKIVSIREDDDNHCEIKLKLTQAEDGKTSGWVFSLAKTRRGAQPPCWLTIKLLKLSEKV